MNYRERREKVQEIRSKKELERQSFVADIKKKSEAARRFINDKRHASYKDLWEAALSLKRSERETLAAGVKDNDEYLRRSLILDTQIQDIKWFLETPHKFIDAENKLKGESND